MSNKRTVYGEFVVRPYENELYRYALKHANNDFKYIRKERKNGKWRYYYDEDTKGGRSLKDQKVTSGKVTKDTTLITSSNSKNNTSALIKPDMGNSPKTSNPDLKNARTYKRITYQHKELPSKTGKMALIKPDTLSPSMFEKKEETKKSKGVNYGVDHGPAARFYSIEEMPKKTSEMSADEDQKVVNPKYDPNESMYSTNCAYCSATWDLRRRGYDVEAQPATSKYDTDAAEIASWYGAGIEDFKGISSESKLKYGTQTCEDDIEASLLSEGEGSYGNFVMFWNNGGGHSVVWTVENGTVMIRDTQLNTVDSYDDYMKKYRDYLDSYWYLRTDNREITPAILEVAKRREERKSVG